MFNGFNIGKLKKKSPETSLRKEEKRMGYKVKEIRKQRKMSQAELAKKSGVSRATISAIENNTTRPVMSSTLLAIAAALETPVDRIFFENCVK